MDIAATPMPVDPPDDHPGSPQQWPSNLGIVRNGDRPAGLAADAGLTVLFLAAIVIEAVAVGQSWGPTYWLIGGTAATVVCLLALLLRRRHPIPTAAAGLAVAGCTVAASGVFQLPSEPGPAMALGLAVLVGAAVRAAPPIPAGLVTAVSFGLVIGSQFAARPGELTLAPVTGLNLLTWLVGVATGLTLRLVDSRAQMTMDRIRQEERLELARELHDVVAHHITGMLLQTQAARVLARRNLDRVPDRLAEIETAGAEALTAMRRVVGLLRDTENFAPSSSEPEQLSTLVERFARQGAPVELSTPEDMTSWPPEMTSTVYRIVREALTNISRHAPHARSVSVTVAQEHEAIMVEVTDDARPASPRPHHRSGYGLIGMRERVETLGGTLEAGPRTVGGWSVAATLPVHPEEPRGRSAA